MTIQRVSHEETAEAVALSREVPPVRTKSGPAVVQVREVGAWVVGAKVGAAVGCWVGVLVGTFVGT